MQEELIGIEKDIKKAEKKLNEVIQMYEKALQEKEKLSSKNKKELQTTLACLHSSSEELNNYEYLFDSVKTKIIALNVVNIPIVQIPIIKIPVIKIPVIKIPVIKIKPVELDVIELDIVKP